MSGEPHRTISLFLDANVLISAAWREGTEISHLWRFAGIQLLASPYVMDEVRRNLHAIDQIERLRGLMRSVRIVTVSGQMELPEAAVLPEKDRPVLIGAVQAEAAYLVSGDKKHFGVLFGTSIRGVRVIPPTVLLAALHMGEL